MKIKIFITTVLSVSMCGVLFAQNPKLPEKVQNVTVKDLDGKATQIPQFGEKNLLIFYIDPDKHKQNEAFTYELEANGRAAGENIMGLGIINLKDAPMVPNALARSLAKKRTEKNGATVLADETGAVRDSWKLGDCNNMFVLLVVSKEGELVYCKKGELSNADKEEFYEFIQAYR
ncbi:MAG: hypothetical protein J1E04_03320 [Alistipes sp.]|nr:hypothetical protein [Alistipes sp.]